MGVWIETVRMMISRRSRWVTPHMGVWIETVRNTDFVKQYTSRPTWACGLKPFVVCWHVITVRVTPHMGVWIETESG